MTPAEVLAGARDLITRDGWWQFGDGQSVGHCTVTAIGRAADLGSLNPAIRLVAEVIGGDGFDAITRWNDAPERTYEDVILALKQAEELAAAEVQS